LLKTGSPPIPPRQSLIARDPAAIQERRNKLFPVRRRSVIRKRGQAVKKRQPI
jgi:hypothetical protein